MSKDLPPGVVFHGSVEDTLMFLDSKGQTVDAFALGRLIGRVVLAPAHDRESLKGLTAGVYRTGGFLSMRAGVFVVIEDGEVWTLPTAMS